MSIEDRGKALEDAFFAKKNKELLDQVRKSLNAETNRGELQAATGISDEGVLDRLIEMGILGESLAAMAIAPLVLVAWADGSVSEKERDAVLAAAEKSGVIPGSTAGDLLAGWLAEKPDETLLENWIAYTKAVSLKLLAGDRVKLSEQVLGRCKAVAEAAGGFLGLGSISSKEQVVLDKLAHAYDV